jgi:hypothetical protein
MAVSIYDVSIPALVRGLTSLSALLGKAADYAVAKKIDPSALLQARLYPDMHAFTRQVQISCDTAKGCAGRLAGVDVPKHEDTESTIPELQARIAKTLDFLRSITPAQLDGAEAREIVLKFPTNTLNFNGLSYVTNFVLPNFYFHLSMAYALLRHNGVEIGKRDFLGQIQ